MFPGHALSNSDEAAEQLTSFQIRCTLNLNADNDSCECAEALKERNFNKLELWRSMCNKKRNGRAMSGALMFFS